MDDMDEVDTGGKFTHVVRSANGTTRPVTTGVPSVFAMGGVVAPPPPSVPSVASVSVESAKPTAVLTEVAKPQRLVAQRLVDRAVDVVAAKGPVTAAEVASALQIPLRQTTNLMWNLKLSGLVTTKGMLGKQNLYVVPNKTVEHPSYSFSMPGPASVAVEPAQPAVAPAVDDLITEAEIASALQVLDGAAIARKKLSCGIFNNGDLIIEAPGHLALRLSREQTRELVAYLDRVAAALAETA